MSPAHVIVDVFTDTPLQGNQLAVPEYGSALSDDPMQRLAREMNHSGQLPAMGLQPFQENPFQERLAQGGMDLLTPVDTDRFLSVPPGLANRRSASILVQAMTCDLDDRRNPAGVIERIPDSEIRAPRVAQHDPAHHPHRPAADALGLPARTWRGSL
jgi:hypothetical protein